jgi:hypothetical protein
MSEGQDLCDMPTALSEAALQRIASRRRSFEEIGFDEAVAFDMAIASIRVQDVVKLLKAGCPLALVPDILL